MSRSIHATRAQYSKLLRANWSDPKVKRREVAELRRQLWAKRSVKSASLEHRHRQDPPGGHRDVTVSIRVVDEGPALCYPLSVEDIQDLLSRLPPSYTSGLAEIQLQLGKAYMEESASCRDCTKTDPITQRRGFQDLPGIYTGPVLGTFSQPGRIRLYAYVVDHEAAKDSPLPFPAALAFLRLQFAGTLLHELSHHFDSVSRRARGRWDMSNDTVNEMYAERMEHAAMHETALPWLQQRFASENRALEDWIEGWGGLRIPYAELANDPRKTQRDGLQRLQGGKADALSLFLMQLVEERLCEGPSLKTWLAFAERLRGQDYDDECLLILDRILAREPRHLAARACKAETLLNLGRNDAAWSLAGEVLAESPKHWEMWSTRALCLRDKNAWSEVIELCEQCFALEGFEQCGEYNFLLELRASACCALGRLEEMEHWLKLRTSELPVERHRTIWRNCYRRAGIPIPLEIEGRFSP